jgi:hypothetical protein
MSLIWDSTVLGTTHETFMTTLEEALEDLSMFGIKAPQIYLRGRRSSIFKEGVKHGDTILAK